VELLPLVSGMHELKGIMVEDMTTTKKYMQEKLLDVYVEHAAAASDADGFKDGCMTEAPPESCDE
jgi:hypothetical protein